MSATAPSVTWTSTPAGSTPWSSERTSITSRAHPEARAGRLEGHPGRVRGPGRIRPRAAPGAAVRSRPARRHRSRRPVPETHPHLRLSRLGGDVQARGRRAQPARRPFWGRPAVVAWPTSSPAICGHLRHRARTAPRPLHREPITCRDKGPARAYLGRISNFAAGIDAIEHVDTIIGSRPRIERFRILRCLDSGRSRNRKPCR